MKKIYLTLIFSIMVTSTFSVKLKAAGKKYEGMTLTIFNVEDYISQGVDGSVDIISNFEEEYGVKVNYYTYDTNETMYNQFTLQKEGTYDLICTSDYMIQRMIKEGLVEPMGDYKEHIPNYENFAASVLRDKLKAMEVTLPSGKIVNLDEYAVGYMWGTLGIVYDPTCSDTIQEDVKSWDVFWDPTYKDLISIKNSIRDAFVTGLMHSYSKSSAYQEAMYAYLDNPTIENCQRYNEMIQDIFDFKLDGSSESDIENKEKIAKVKEELISMKKNIFGFEVDSGKNDIITGKIKLNLAYSGDAVYSISTASEHDITLEYYVPEDGSNIWYDAWTLPKGANRELAYLFLNYLSDPVNAADNMDYIGYTPYIVSDELFTLTSTWYGAADYCVTTAYYAPVEEDLSDETLVIYHNILYACIKDKESDEEIYPDNEEYFEKREYSDGEEYTEGDMVSYLGKIYNCTRDTTTSPNDESCWEENSGYDIGFLFSENLSKDRRAIIYPYYGSENQLETQYPSETIIARCAIMNDFGSYNEDVVIMWGQVKAYTNMIPVYIFLSVFLVVVVSGITFILIRRHILLKYKKRIAKKNTN
jgi:Spermidine/putrescine-binding periplasmic protein